MNCFSCSPIVILSPEGREVKQILEKLTYAYLALVVLRLLLGDFNSFFNELIIIWFLVLTFMQASYIMASITIFILLFDAFYTLIFVMLIIQDYLLGMLERFPLGFLVYFGINLLGLVISITLVHYLFKGYKEFKALFFEQINNQATYSKSNSLTYHRSYT